MERPSLEKGYRLELARLTANDAIRAVALQRDRIKDRNEDGYFAIAGSRQGVDVAFLLVALRWLREACQLVAELTGDETLAQAVHAFDQRLPGARDLRDVREHIRDYIKGSGKLQRDSISSEQLVSVASLGTLAWLDPDEPSHFRWAGKEIWIDDAVLAAESLFDAMRQAIAPYLLQDSISGREGIEVQVDTEHYRDELRNLYRSGPGG